jgi:hypothetical protein
MSTRLVVKRMRVLALGTLFVGAAAILLDLGRAGPCSADQPPAATQPAFTNRLAKEGSPYLQQHAHNPVDWYPWGTEAFEKAKKENKPIFLSIGYSTCHWCHVMEQESFTLMTTSCLSRLTGKNDRTSTRFT